MPGGLADVVDVDGADTLLDAGRPAEVGGLLAEEVRLERHHAGVDDQQRRILGDQTRAGHDGVPPRLEMGEEAATNLGGVHPLQGA